MPSGGRVSFGLIGCGGIGAYLADRFNGLEDGAIVAVSDVDPNRGKDLCKKLGAAYIPDLNGLLSSKDLQAVIVAVPNHLHADLTVKAASAGKHIFCEKPMALSVADCDRMIEAASKNRVKLMVGHVLRLFPIFAKIKGIIDQGAIGETTSISLRRLGKLDLASSWRREKSLSGGGLFEVSVHELDYMRYLAGDAEEVYSLMDRHIPGEIDYEGSGLVALRFANGVLGSLSFSTTSAIGLYDGVIQGTKGTLFLSQTKGFIEHASPDGTKKEKAREDIKAEDPYRAELRNFIGSILCDEKLLLDGTDGRKAVEMAEGAILSSRRREPVKLPLRKAV